MQILCISGWAAKSQWPLERNWPLCSPSVSCDSALPLKFWLISLSCPLNSLWHKLQWCSKCHQIGNWKDTWHVWEGFRWRNKSVGMLLSCSSQKISYSCPNGHKLTNRIMKYGLYLDENAEITKSKQIVSTNTDDGQVRNKLAIQSQTLSWETTLDWVLLKANRKK